MSRRVPSANARKSWLIESSVSERRTIWFYVSGARSGLQASVERSEELLRERQLFFDCGWRSALSASAHQVNGSARARAQIPRSYQVLAS
jgi:hypothetical protein